MKLSDFKTFIKEDRLSDEFLILKYDDNSFIAKQYVDAIANLKNKSIKFIDNLKDNLNVQSEFSLFEVNDFLHVLCVDIFDEQAEDYSVFENCIVICNKIDKSIANAVSSYVVEFPKATDWQTKSYITTVCKELSQESINCLYEYTGGNIYKINNVLDSLMLFDKEEREELFTSLLVDRNTDLFYMSFLDFVDAIVTKNNYKVYLALKHIDCCDIDPIALVNALTSKFKNFLFVKYNSGRTNKELEISDKYAWYIKHNINNWTEQELSNQLKFLTSIDYRLKSGKLDISKNILLDYIVSNIIKNERT